MNGAFISLESKLFTKYLGQKLRLIYYFYIAQVAEEFGAVWLLGSDI